MGAPKRAVNTALSASDVSGPSTHLRQWSRSCSDGGVALMWAMARPTVLKKVHRWVRTSSRKADAEKRRRSTTRHPAWNAGSRLEKRAFPWNRGMAEYRVSSGPKGRPVADRTALPWLTLTALGWPVEPEVNM